ncbi:hypothetical protein [Streptomyces sp. UNOB3_S3]|uniref:DUF7683 domain-containing protein n=1 Tax=Streptomyces sp. UNOB3_S3 TaxID=2871682 RepID=UPI001E3832C5|nr:hypothetical protein [Streptomyces sp. UNOB3_S3]MCC3777022.1 hypothetical protein [Streptomyces sp. UNOB3_S3]
MWSLDGFSKEDEPLRAQFPISREQIAELRKVVKPDPDDPWLIGGCYPAPVEFWPEIVTGAAAAG